MKEKKFYGYTALIMTGITCGMVSSTSLIFGIYLQNLIDGMGTDFVMYYPTVATLTAVVLGLFMGKFIQKTSIQFVIAVGALGMALSCFLMATGHGSTMVILAAVSMGLGAAYGMFAPISIIVNEWFIKGRAKLNGTAIGSMSVLGVVVCFIGAQMYPLGYKLVYLIFAGINAALAVFTLILVRSPEAKGQQPLGWAEGVSGDEADATVVRKGLMLKEALKTPAFWIVLFSGWLLAVIGEGLYSFFPSYLTEECGTAVEVANNMPTLVLVFVFVGGMVAGRVADKYGNKVMTIVLTMVYAVGHIIACFIYPQNMSIILLVLVSAIMGFGSASYSNITPLVCAECFGDKDFDAISPIFAMASQAGSATCPILMGIAIGMGSMGIFYKVSIVALVICMITMILGISVSPMKKSN